MSLENSQTRIQCLKVRVRQSMHEDFQTGAMGCAGTAEFFDNELIVSIIGEEGLEFYKVDVKKMNLSANK